MNTPNRSSDETDELSGVLGLAVAQRGAAAGGQSKRGGPSIGGGEVAVRESEVAAARWSRSKIIATISAIAAVLALVAVLPFWRTKPAIHCGFATGKRRASSRHRYDNDDHSLHGELGGIEPDPPKYFGINADGAQHMGTIAAGVQPMGNNAMHAGTSPSRRMAVAGGSTIIVSNGEEIRSTSARRPPAI